MRSAFALTVFAIAPLAHAGSGDWGGLYDGRALQSGGEVFVEGGFPGVGLGALFGTSESVDLGLRFTLTYSGLGVYATDNFTAAVGIDPRVVARFAVVRGKVLSFLFRLEPGVRVARFDPTRWGPEVVVGADFGIRLTPRGSLLLGLEIPIYLDIPNTTPANPFAVYVPILIGAGFEYHATDLIGFGARFAPGVNIAVGDLPKSPLTSFAFIAQGYFMLRWGT
jgi:hypothetical protein